MSTRGTILIAEDGINNVHVYTEAFETEDLIYMETWCRNVNAFDDDEIEIKIITMPHRLWEQFKLKIIKQENEQALERK